MEMKKMAVILALLMLLSLTGCFGRTAGAPVIAEVTTEPTPEPAAETDDAPLSGEIALDPSWTYANESAINSGSAVLYRAENNRKSIIIGVNAGHGTEGGSAVKTFCHPDHSPKTTGGSTAAGADKATAVAGGMTFNDGTPEPVVTLRMAQLLRDMLLADGYDVLMLRDGADVQLDNVARTVICNNAADCHIALHWDSDGSGSDKGCFFCSVPESIQGMEPVSSIWQEHMRLGECLVEALRQHGEKIFSNGQLPVDLTQTSYSTVPSVDIELGNEYSVHDDSTLTAKAEALVNGINAFFTAQG